MENFLSSDIINILSIGACIIVLVLLFRFINKRKAKRLSKLTNESFTQRYESFNKKLATTVGKPKKELWKRIESLFQGKLEISDESWEAMEEILYSADIGTLMVSELNVAFRNAVKEKKVKPEDFKEFFFSFLKEKLNFVQSQIDPSLYKFSIVGENKDRKTKVIMVVGVNGAGKTTSVGKLASRLKAAGKTVVVGACDTFRAAAVEQLSTWGERAQVKVIKLKVGASPSAVAYEALETALKENADYCILDTAGRLHTKGTLMDELKKMKKVLSKLDPTSPHEVFLVIDAITGQNAIRQAEEFNNALGLTGLIFTKCDGSSKAGSAISIVTELKVPIIYIGIGENIEDLDIFDLDQYLKALLCID